jgi:hypothetical protein
VSSSVPACPSSTVGSRADCFVSTNRSAFGSKTGGRFQRSGGALPKSGAQAGLRFGRNDGETYSLHSSEDWGRATEVTRWQPSSIRQLPLYCNRRHGFAASACPPAFLPIGTRVPTCALAWLAAAARLRMAGVHSSFPFGKARSIVVTEPIQLRFDFTRLPARPPNTPTSSYYFRHSNKHDQTKPNSLGHRFSGTAFGWSSFLTFVSRRSLELRSAPTVNPACAALRGEYPKTAPCSLPRP